MAINTKISKYEEGTIISKGENLYLIIKHDYNNSITIIIPVNFTDTEYLENDACIINYNIHDDIYFIRFTDQMIKVLWDNNSLEFANYDTNIHNFDYELIISTDVLSDFLTKYLSQYFNLDIKSMIKSIIHNDADNTEIIKPEICEITEEQIYVGNIYKYNDIYVLITEYIKGDKSAIGVMINLIDKEMDILPFYNLSCLAVDCYSDQVPILVNCLSMMVVDLFNLEKKYTIIDDVSDIISKVHSINNIYDSELIFTDFIYKAIRNRLDDPDSIDFIEIDLLYRYFGYININDDCLLYNIDYLHITKDQYKFLLSNVLEIINNSRKPKLLKTKKKYSTVVSTNKKQSKKEDDTDASESKKEEIIDTSRDINKIINKYKESSKSMTVEDAKMILDLFNNKSNFVNLDDLVNIVGLTKRRYYTLKAYCLKVIAKNDTK